MSIPVIFLTSKDDEVDELLGLKLGADDFVKKSGGFSTKVLIERIRVQLRKKTNTVDDTKNIISHGKRPGVIKERAHLMDIAYKENTEIEDRTIDSHVKRIRKKFKKVDEKFSAIETRYGSGYRWNVS